MRTCQLSINEQNMALELRLCVTSFFFDLITVYIISIYKQYSNHRISRSSRQLTTCKHFFRSGQPIIMSQLLNVVIHFTYINKQMSQQNKQHGELFSGSDFGEKVSFTVGSSYGVGFLLGLARGFRQGIPKSFKMPRKLIMNNFFNAVGKQTGRLGNAFAGAGLLYYLVGGALNFIFEDQLEEMQPIYKNIICGGVTGMIYKSTLGVVPLAVGGILGASLIGGLTLLVEEGNRRGIVAFEMKY